MRYRLLTGFIGALAVAPWLAGRAGADADTYVAHRTVVRAGIITSSALSSGAAGSENPDPHVFFVLDGRKDLKPEGMEFLNPLAPGTVTGSIMDRWQRRSGGGDPALGAAFSIGARITKNMGAYWEVNIDTLSSDDLLQYDLLFLHTHKPNVAFTPEERAKLQRFVENGGTLWVDNCGGFTFARGALFLFDAQYHTGAPPSSGRPIAVAASAHPLLTQPYALSPLEIQTLGDKGVGGYYLFNPLDPNDPSYYDATAGKDALNPPGREVLVPVVWNTRGFDAVNAIAPNPAWRPYVLAGQVGAGRIVLCAEDTGCAINDYVGGSSSGYGANSGVMSGEDLLAAKPQDLKFAYNLAVWATANRTPQADPRRSGSSSQQIATGLEEKWGQLGAGSGRVGGAVVFKRCVYSVGGDLVLRCFDLSPGEDRDGDGVADDGIPDFGMQGGPDLIWQLDLRSVATGSITGASAPTVVEFYDPASTGTSAHGEVNLPQRELVVVVLSDGTVVATRALPWIQAGSKMLLHGATSGENVDWVIPPSVTGAVDFGLTADQTVPAPAWSEGVLFVALNTSAGGRLAAMDPRTGSSALRLSRPVGVSEALIPDAPGTTGAIISSPSVGTVADEATGAVDTMVYAHVASGSGQPGSVRAYQFCTKGEPLSRIGPVLYRSRARTPWFVWSPSTASVDGDNPAHRQRVRAVFMDGVSGAIGSTELVYTDSASPGAGQYTCKYEASEARILTGDTVDIPWQDVTGATGTYSGTPGDARVSIYADYTLNWSPRTTDPPAKVNARSVFIAPDPSSTSNFITGAPALTASDMLLFSVDTSNAGTPQYPGTSVMLCAREQAASKTSVRWAYVMNNAFDMTVNNASQQYPPRLLDATVTPSRYLTNVRFVGSPATRNGTVYAVARTDQGVSVLCAFREDQDFIIRLQTQIENGARIRIRQPNLFSTTTGAWIEVAPSQYTVDYASGLIRITAMAPPGNVATNFVSASLPFIVQVGTSPEVAVISSRTDANGTPRGGPEGIDNLLWYRVFDGEATSSPAIQGSTVWVGLRDGRIASFDAEPAYSGGGSQILAPPAWQPLVGTSPVLSPPIAVDRTLLVSNGDGTFAYEDSRVLIVDSGRILEVNAAGEAVWACDGTRAYKGNRTAYPPGGVSSVQMVRFSRPAVARRINTSSILVVDTGNNRVLEMDRGGNVVWEVSQLQDTFWRLLRPGDPLSLNEPTDCAWWSEWTPDLRATLGQPLEAIPGYIVHYLVADSGNFRVVELVDVYKATGEVVSLRQLRYVSSTYGVQGRHYRYRNVQRLTLNNDWLPADPPSYRQGYASGVSRVLTLATVQNKRLVDPSIPVGVSQSVGESSETGGGSIALLREDGSVMAAITTLRVPSASGPVLQALSNVTWMSSFMEIVGGVPIPKFLICDANGVYVARPNFVSHSASPAWTETVMEVEWLLTAEDYYRMTGKKLLASSASRLSTSANNPAMPNLRQFLITNGFSGEDNPSIFGVAYNTSGDPTGGNISGSSEFHGEVFVVRPKTFDVRAADHGYIPDYTVSSGFLVVNPLASIIRRIPVETLPRPPAAGFAGEVGVVKRRIGSHDNATSTHILEQPTYAERPL